MRNLQPCRARALPSVWVFATWRRDWLRLAALDPLATLTHSSTHSAPQAPQVARVRRVRMRSISGKSWWKMAAEARAEPNVRADRQNWRRVNVQVSQYSQCRMSQSCTCVLQPFRHIQTHWTLPPPTNSGLWYSIYVIFNKAPYKYCDDCFTTVSGWGEEPIHWVNAGFNFHIPFIVHILSIVIVGYWQKMYKPGVLGTTPNPLVCPTGP